MNICVCIKQVPASSNVKINPETGTLVRDGNNTKMNPYDLYAIELALKIKEIKESNVKALTMGPPAATSILEEAIWMGCDDGYLLTDSKFAGADVVATAYTISQGIKYMGKFDLVVCGKQTTDGDTAQVGAELAHFLGIPYVCYVDQVLEVKEKSIVVRCNLDKTYETLEVDFPCLITVEKSNDTPRLPSYKRSVQFSDHQMHTITFNKLFDTDESRYGLKGSPTQVERMFNPIKDDRKVMLNDEVDSYATQLKELLKDRKYI
ncbi:MAG: electron transfer flavoprotein subunit beta/FixA family protein [Erysipelotrichaceae bacterium]|nr:electron transfer flavoprotein subunit beta/FixA family protein [Erysipelotrichaceae bacterium]